MTFVLHTTSYYAATTREIIEYPQLSGDNEADVCIIGGGFTGSSAALHLAERGYSVILLDANRIGWGASGRNGGLVGTGQHVDVQVLEKMVGKRDAKQLWNLSLEAVQLVKDLIIKHSIPCDLRHGILHAAWKKKDAHYFATHADWMHTHYGYEGYIPLSKQALRERLGSDAYWGGEIDVQGAHLHPLNYAIHLAGAASLAGAKIYENSKVIAYNKGDPVIVKTADAAVKAKYVLLACNGYLGRLEPKVAGKIMPINNFILATEPLEETRMRTIIRDDMAVADSKFVLNYYRMAPDRRFIFGGGENYSAKFPFNLKSFVRKHMLEVFPNLHDVNIDYAWGGTLAITLNRMPHFGRISDNIYIAHGYSGHGVALATLAGKLIAEALSGTAERFDVMARIPVRTFPGGTLLRYPTLVLGMLYYSLLDRFP